MGSLLFMGTNRAQAGFWGEPIIASIMKQTMETIQRQIEGAVLGTLKVAAVQILNSQIGQLIAGGGGGQPLIITDFHDFLIRTPQEEADLYMNDFFTVLFGSKGSAANFAGAGDSGSVKGNYVSYLRDTAESVTIDKEKETKKYDLDQYCPNPDVLFETGSFRCLDKLLEPQNNPHGVAQIAEHEYAKILEEEKTKQEVIAQSSGFKPALDSKGNVITPAQTIGDLVTSVNTLGNEIVAAANNPAEFLGSLVTGFVSRTVTNLVQQGIGKVQQNIQREVGNVTNQIDREIGRVTREIGPAAQLIDQTLQQRTNGNIGPSGRRLCPNASANGEFNPDFIDCELRF